MFSPDGTWQRPGIFLIPAGSLMARSHSLLSWQKIPCSDAQGISEYRVEIAVLFGAHASPESPNGSKFAVFSQLAGNFRTTEGQYSTPLAKPGESGGAQARSTLFHDQSRLLHVPTNRRQRQRGEKPLGEDELTLILVIEVETVPSL